MITNIYAGGGIGNQLIFLSNILATAIEERKAFNNIAFKASKYFEINPKNFSCINCWGGKKTIFFQKYVNGCRKFHVPIVGIKCFWDDSQGMREYFLKEKKGRVYCWPYYDLLNLYKNQDAVRQAIIPQKKYCMSVKQEMQELRENYEYVIGVHIRRKDYRYWLQSKYFYDFSVYRSCISNVNHNFSNAVYVLFSDEEIPEDMYDHSLNFYKIKDSSEINDLLFLSMCDYIIGPPSTYSGWASFYGNVPKYTIFSASEVNTNINISSFGVYMIDYIDDKMDLDGNKCKQSIKKGCIID